MAEWKGKNEVTLNVPSDTDEVARLKAENARLQAENTRLRAGGKPADRQEFVPDWIPQGTAVELEQTGRAVNPFTGERLGDWSDVDDAVTAQRPAIGEDQHNV